MTHDACIKSLSFVPFSNEGSFINNEYDPDVNFYNDVFTQEILYLIKFKETLSFFQDSHCPPYTNHRSTDQRPVRNLRTRKKLNSYLTVNTVSVFEIMLCIMHAY